MKLRHRLLALAALGVLAACGETSAPPAASGGPGKQDKIAAEVPSDIKSKGALQIGVDATYLPNEGIDPDTGQIVGWDIDLGYALGKVMGVPFVFNNADFSSIIPDIGTRYDLGISSFSPTAGFGGGKLGGGTNGGAAVELGPGKCEPTKPVKETSEARGTVAASGTSVTVASLTCTVPASLQAKVTSLVGMRAEIHCALSGGVNNLVKIEKK